MYLNKVSVMGNLTRTPELKILAEGLQVSNLSIAVNKVWNDKEGKKQESVQFISVSVFGKQAETCCKYLVKGQKVYVEGEINNRVIPKDDGTNEYKTGIIARNVQFGQKPGHSDSKSGETTNTTSNGPTVKPMGMDGIDYGAPDINYDDIPF